MLVPALLSIFSAHRFESRIPLVQVDIGLLADQVGVTATDTLYLGQGVHDLLLTLDIGVQQSKDLSIVRTLRFGIRWSRR
jgi:hypothetical protein